MNPSRYVPCLRWKQGEYQAVSRLSNAARASIVPLIEVPEMGFDFETRQNRETIDEHLAPLGKRLCKNWGLEPCMVDLRCLDAGLRMANGDHPLAYLFDRFRRMGARAIPVAALTSERHQREAARKVVAADKRGICIRVGIEEAARNELKSLIDSLMAEIGVDERECDFVLDIGAPSFEPLEDFAGLVESLITNLPHINRWRSLTLLGASLPSTLAGVPRGTTVLPRQEWRLYRLLRGLPSMANTRLPDFGDYGIGHPGVIQEDLRLLKPSAAIRYTIDDGWLIARGTSVRVPGGFRQFPRLSEQIVKSRYYAGPNYSAGDRKIADCASGNGGTGNLTTWRFVGTSHHLEKLARDLASWREP